MTRLVAHYRCASGTCVYYSYICSIMQRSCLYISAKALLYICSSATSLAKKSSDVAYTCLRLETLCALFFVRLYKNTRTLFCCIRLLVMLLVGVHCSIFKSNNFTGTPSQPTPLLLSVAMFDLVEYTKRAISKSSRILILWLAAIPICGLTLTRD